MVLLGCRPFYLHSTLWTIRVTSLCMAQGRIPVSELLSNTGSGNGLVPSDNKRLPEPMLIYYQLDLPAFIPGQCLLEYSR